MDQCCEGKATELAGVRLRQGYVLVDVLAVNATMFCVEFGAGLLSGSTALLADSRVFSAMRARSAPGARARTRDRDHPRR